MNDIDKSLRLFHDEDSEDQVQAPKKDNQRDSGASNGLNQTCFSFAVQAPEEVIKC